MTSFILTELRILKKAVIKAKQIIITAGAYLSFKIVKLRFISLLANKSTFNLKKHKMLNMSPTCF